MKEITQGIPRIDEIPHEDRERIEALIYIGQQIEQRLAGIELRMAGLEAHVSTHKKLLDMLHERFSARPVLVTWMIFLGVPLGLLALAAVMK